MRVPTTLLSSLLLILIFVLYSENAEAKPIKISYYSNKFDGKTTKSGQIYKKFGKTAASNRYKAGTILHLIYKGKQIKVCVNDTGGFRKFGRDLDVSYGVAKCLGFLKEGVVLVDSKVVYLPKHKEVCKAI